MASDLALALLRVGQAAVLGGIWALSEAGSHYVRPRLGLKIFPDGWGCRHAHSWLLEAPLD